MAHPSLKEAYTLAHSAECRLHMEANRPERNMRFLVGHLMHYENLRLHIVEIEHDISKRENSSLAFKGTGHVDRLQKKPSTGQLGRRRSPPPPPNQLDSSSEGENDDDDEDSDSNPYSGSSSSSDDDADGQDLALTRFPSGSARPPQPPDLVDDDSDEDDPASPEEPDQATLEDLLKKPGSSDLANVYEGMKKCPCHRKTDKPSFERMWELPRREGQREGVTRAVAQVWV